MKKIIDYFPFFNEKELLELRLNLLNDHVDEFIISELNYTHSGNPKQFICQKLVDDLGFSEKVRVLELEIDESDLVPNEIDRYSAQESKSDKEVFAWVRERLQRDALLRIIDEYEDDIVFILSDCDEIIDPKYLDYFSNVCRNLDKNIIKVPLVLLEGRADKRLFDGEIPVPWSNSLLLCTSKQLKNNGSPTKMRSNILNEYFPVWVTENDKQIEDCGWHFTWMGDNQRREEKAKSFIHYANLNSVNTLSNNSFEKIVLNEKDGYENVLNSQFKYESKNYPINLLPKVIFDLQRVKNFLLPSEKNESLKQKIKTIYKEFDNQFGVWGWCPQTKSDMIIDCVMEVCQEQQNPVCVEIGVYGGKSFLPFGLALKELKKGIVYGIDPWLNEEALIGYDHPAHQEFWGKINLEHMYNICMLGIDNLKINDYVSILRTTSDDAQEIKNISVLHIDGQHTDQLIKDINKYAVNVIDGGYCFLDDVGWSEETLKSIPLIESLGFEKVSDIFGCILYQKKKTKKEFNFYPNLNCKSTTWVVDNFYENPDEVREFALKQEYVEGGFGRGFIGRRTVSQFLFPGLKERFEQIMGKKITAWQEHGMNGRFQVAWSGEPLVYHCDSQKYGGMIYLTPNAPYQCGTTLYAHKKTKARTYYEEGWDAGWRDVPGGSHLDGTHFEPVDVLGNVYNRLAIFDGSAIHSASEYFGTVMENARLWQMFFFDVE
jgi:hypothetical protein